MAKSKVMVTNPTRKRSGPNGDVFYHTMEMENMDKVNIGKKTDNFFKVGDEIDYEVVSTDEYGVKKIKEIKEAFVPKTGGSYTKDYKKDSVSYAASYTKDLIVGGKAELKDFEKLADKIYARMNFKF